jgi:hypothetical protein
MRTRGHATERLPASALALALDDDDDDAQDRE